MNTEYKLAFGRGGLTVDYEDAGGKFTFVFDTAPRRQIEGGREKLLVSRRPVKGMQVWECRNEDDLKHLETMLERVKEYLVSLGYEGEVV